MSWGIIGGFLDRNAYLRVDFRVSLERVVTFVFRRHLCQGCVQVCFAPQREFRDRVGGVDPVLAGFRGEYR